MLSPAFRNNLSIPALLLLLAMMTAARVEAADTAREVTVFTGNHPAAETLFVPSLDFLPPAGADAAWYARTGARKGLSGQAVTPEELFAAPDVAVLNRGFAALWAGLLAEQQEASVLVHPDEIAGLVATKPLLVIPSGALSGTGNSAFFKAGLAHYARSGGIIYCLAQQAGRDYSALPVPAGSRVEGAGWSEDSGPLFRASTARTTHLLLRGLNHPLPAVETEGFFTAFPESAQVLLTRSDGAATLILYPFGKGWVLAGTMFTDFASLLGNAEKDEKLIIRNLLAMKSEPGQTQPAPAPGAPPVVPNKTAGSRERSERPAVYASAERKDDLVKVTLEIPGTPRLQGEQLLVRMNGQEQAITPGNDSTVLSKDITPEPNQRRISFALYRKDGRALVRGSVEVPSGPETTAAMERQYYFPGETATVAFRGTGKGEVTLRGLDHLDNKIMADRGSMGLQVPGDLPAGAYRLQWSLEKIDGQRTAGEVTLDLCGYRVAFEQVDLESRREGAAVRATAKFRIFAGAAVSGKLHLQLRGPGGQTMTVAEPVVGLAEGSQLVPVSFEFSPDAAGLWELTYRFSTVLPRGAGLPTHPVELASSGTLIDVGSSAILAVTADKVFYYDPAGRAGAQALLFGTGKAILSIQLDGKKIAKEQVQLSEAASHGISLPPLTAGSHRIAVTLQGEGEPARREHVLIYGLSFPDLRGELSHEGPRSSPDGPVLPLKVLVRNSGKGPSGPSILALYDGDPAEGAKAFARLDVPQLGRGQQHSVAFDLPLYRKAGRHTLFAVVNAARSVQESRDDNNRASAAVTLPDILLLPDAQDPSFSVGDAMDIHFSVFNLTALAQKDLSFGTAITDPAGKHVNADKVPLPLLNAGEGRRMAHAVNIPMPARAGTYGISANVSRQSAITSASTRFTVLPTLLLTGSLEGSADAGVLCSPLSVRYSVRSAGNIFPTSGMIRFEMTPAGSDKPSLVKEFPLRLGEQTFAISELDLPPGPAIARLKVSASNEKQKMTRDFILAERTVPVAGPIAAARKQGTFPRVLVWLGREGRTVEQAVTEAIVKQAFEQDDLLYRVVDSEEAFTVQSRTGMFNTYVLIEPQEMPAAADRLRDRIDQGQGLLLVGTGTVVRQLGELFGFSFEEARTVNAATAVSFVRTPGGMDLTGSLPVNGTVLHPRKQGAAEAGVYSPSGRPAVLVDGSRSGKTVVMPVSFSSSAYTAGTPGIYSMILRSMALFAAPESDSVGNGPKPIEFSIASRVGPVRVRIQELLPPGARPVWTSAGGRISGNTITYEVVAGKEPKKLLYLYEQPRAGIEGPSADVLYECNGSFASQGKIE